MVRLATTPWCYTRVAQPGIRRSRGGPGGRVVRCSVRCVSQRRSNRRRRESLTGNDTATATGTITIAGVTQPVEFDVRLVESPDGVRTEGETQIDLTDFSVAPPKLWRGLLKVGKVVRVQFDAVLR